MSSDAAERLVAGRWNLQAALRRGRAGVVWRATDLEGGAPLAVEELELPAGMGDAEWAELWTQVTRQVRAAAGLGHPGMVGLRDVVAENGRVYVATELLEALTLDELVAKHGPLPSKRVAQIGLDVLDVLEASHAAGLAHLDLRPGNVLVAADGRARLAGLGLAALRGDRRLGPAGAGGPYLAPEQARGDPAGPPADLWALGATLYFAVEGEPPFGGDGGQGATSAVLGERPRQAVLAGQLTPALGALLTKPVGGRPTVAETRRLLEPLAGRRPTAAPRAAAPATQGWGWAPAGPGVAGPVAPGRAARAGMDPELRRLLLIAGGSVLLALLSFVVAVAVIGDPLGVRSRAAPSTAATVPPTTSPPSTTLPPTTSPASQAVVPPGWSVHTDPATGYQVAVPPGWRVERDGDNRTELHDGGSPTVLRIDWRQEVQADPVAAEQQAGQDYADDVNDYQQARLEPAEFKGLQSALLEFTFRDDDDTWHALELGMRAPRHYIAMAIYAKDEDWGQGWALFEAFKASFVPPQ
jgi:serine/threonine protein kinase